MTKRELNNDIKKLAKCLIFYKGELPKCEYVDHYAKQEFERLYYAMIGNLELFTKESLIIMLRLNISYCFIPLHRFGSHLKIEQYLN